MWHEGRRNDVEGSVRRKRLTLHANRLPDAAVPLLLLLVGACIAWSWPVASGSEQCRMGMAMTCMLDSLNMSSDGIATLRQIPPNVFYAIRVEVVRMPENPAGVFLQRMAEFVNKIEVYTYREPVFQLLPGTSLTALAVYSAKALTQLLVAPTASVSQLLFANCALGRVPPTIGNLAALEDLTVTECALQSFTFDSFTGNPRLTTLDLSRNEIHTIVPTTSQAAFALAIENLYLAWNRIEKLDMAAFVSLVALRGLDLSNNLLLTVASLSSVSWPLLAFWNLEHNQLTGLDLQWLSAPSLERLMLANNAFEAMPQRLRRFPSLQLVALSDNRLRTIDLAPFNGLPALNTLDFSFNPEARVVRTSRPTSLPALNSLYAESCALGRFNTTGLDLPAINFISLAGNNFSVVPRLFAPFPTLESFSLENNAALPCAALQANTELIMSGRLILGFPMDPKRCPRGSVTLDRSLTLCCKATSAK